MKSMLKKVHFCEYPTVEKPTRLSPDNKPGLHEVKPSLDEVQPNLDEVLQDVSPTGCGMMNLFGIKSYLHHFYDKKSIENCRETSYDILTEPSSEPHTYLMERGKRRYTSRYFRAFILLGILLLSIGLSLLIIGHFHSYRNPIIEVRSTMEVIDRRSLAFNYSLEMYRIIGLAVFCTGGIVIMLTLLVDIYRTEMVEPSKRDWEREQEFYIVWE